MSRELLLHMHRRTMVHAAAGTVPQAETIHQVPATNYYDRERWTLEIDRIFKRVPLTLGFSCELSEPGSYRAMEVAGVPLILSRGSDGVLRSFVNMCSHRGAMLMEAGTGTARRFTCPYHAWSYNTEGALVGILDRAEFGEVDVDCNGLVELPCEERAGIIFGSVTPAVDLDLDRFLCGYDSMLNHFEFETCRLVGRQSVSGPNWKVAYDGYLDFYHLPILHKETFGPDFNNKAIYDAWGPHQRVSSPDAHMLRLRDVAKDALSTKALTAGIWTIFPHVSIARFDLTTDGGSEPVFMISQLLPGDDPGVSVTTQHFLAPFDPDAEQKEAIAAQMAFLLHVVRDEDYFTGARIQRALQTGLKSHVLFGRNEAGGQRFHLWVDRLVTAETTSDYEALLASAEVHHQP